MERPGKAIFDKVVLECVEPNELADFYSNLLGLKKGYVTDDFVILAACGGADIAFQRNEDYIPPVWPDKEGEQQMMAHIDVAVPRALLDQWKQYAISLGAKPASVQYSDDWIVMLDPSGHPFCLDAT